MTADDIDRAATDLALYRRAFARCTVSVPHRDADEDVPCSGCLLAAARQLAIPASHLSAPASSLSGSASAGRAGSDDGGPGGAPAEMGRAETSTPNSNRPGTLDPRAAESGPVRPQTGR